MCTTDEPVGVAAYQMRNRTKTFGGKVIVLPRTPRTNVPLAFNVTWSACVPSAWVPSMMPIDHSSP
ncbi:MAG: hypothetical protein QM736_14550 [Vicinamibacterales bacterium]